LPVLVPGYPNLRKAFLKDAEILRTDAQLQGAIAAGRMIVWGGAPNAPSVETSFPSIAALRNNADATKHQIEMTQGWNVTYFAHLKNRASEAAVK
jgi:hypothetical protein